MMRWMLLIIGLLLSLPCPACQAADAGPVDPADSWTDYRGPNQDGRSPATGLPTEWAEGKNVKWKTAIHGRGWSTPAILGDQIWLTTATEDGKKMSALCIDRNSGKILHDLPLFENTKVSPLGNSVNSYASPSPVIEPGRVYISFGSYGTACLETATGKTLWQRRDLPCEHFRGPASSPFLYKNLLILHMDGSDHQYIVALDTQTGKTVWKKDRSTNFGDIEPNGKPAAGGDYRKAYNTPIVVELDGKPQLISPHAKGVIAYDPRDGSEIWNFRHPNHSTAARTIYGHGLFYVNIGYSKAEIWAIKAGGKGDITSTHIAWKMTQRVPNRSSPVLVDGLLYMVNDSGIALCADAVTGEEIWRQRIDGNYSASALYADGKIHFFGEDGSATIIKPGRQFDLVAKNKLDDGFMACPAVAGKALYLRTKTHLYRIEQ